MNCPHCGSEYKEGWKFCTNCAKPLPNETGNIPDVAHAPVVPSTLNKDDTKPGPLSKFFAGIIILLIVMYFTGMFDGLFAKKTNFATPLSAPSTQKRPSDSLQIQQGWEWESTGYGYSTITGSVKNIGDKPIKYFEVTAEYKDENGNVLDTAYTNSAETIRPGNEKRFEIMHKHSPDFKKASIHVNRVMY
jgi:hypothetical protein